MKKIFYVALREFLATALTKGFLIGLAVPPLIGALMILVFPALLSRKPPSVSGEVAILDPTGRLAPALRSYLSPETIASRYDRQLRRGLEEAPEAIRKVARSALSDSRTRRAIGQAAGEPPRLEVVVLDSGADLEREKQRLREADGGRGTSEPKRLALVVIHPDAIERAAGREDFGAYDLYVRAKLDDRVESEIRAGLEEAIVDARVERAGLDRKLVESLTRVPRVRARTVTAQGEKAFDTELNIFVPMGLAALLLMSVLTGGQSLLTTTVEEKSNRVVEILLSAVSPMELMTGKILGQMCVGLAILAIYAGAGLLGLFSFALLGLVDPKLIVYLVVFFLLTYFVVGAAMAAIGAAVNEMREAQTLLTPLLLVLMIPWFLWFPITRSPNSLLATVLSLLPPMNGFAMLLRMASSSPPPAWQVGLSMVIGAASVYGALWFAAKVFRVGLLMYGKPPNLATLIRWVRMA
jgi:ABC-type Na+ efflux pump permease subunit